MRRAFACLLMTGLPLALAGAPAGRADAAVKSVSIGLNLEG